MMFALSEGILIRIKASDGENRAIISLPVFTVNEKSVQIAITIVV